MTNYSDKNLTQNNLNRELGEFYGNVDADKQSYFDDKTCDKYVFKEDDSKYSRTNLI